MNASDVNLGEWITHLRRLSDPILNDPFTPYTETEQCLHEITNGEPRVTRPPASPDSEELVWQIAVDPKADIDRLLSRGCPTPIFDQGLFRAIEVWTESELSGLHALWRVARMRCDEELIAWCARLRDWHIEHTQPDNATNRPWALHVFLLHKSPESVHYAQTLLHNSIAMEGRPTPLCARILADAANELEVAHSKK